MSLLDADVKIPKRLKQRKSLAESSFHITLYESRKLSKKLNMDGSVKGSNSRRANFVIMRRTYCTLNGCEMKHNAEVGLFTEPSYLTFNFDLSKVKFYP
jgi:hypothetical protein